jgi:hypothetical protein
MPSLGLHSQLTKLRGFRALYSKRYGEEADEEVAKVNARSCWAVNGELPSEMEAYQDTAFCLFHRVCVSLQSDEFLISGLSLRFAVDNLSNDTSRSSSYCRTNAAGGSFRKRAHALSSKRRSARSAGAE